MICPECKREMSDNANKCLNCGFDLAMYRQEYDRIYMTKIQKLNEMENMTHKTMPAQTQNVHKPRCPYCNSENLTRITSLDKAVNIALFGVFGNKRKYQWHCNNCKTNW